MTACNTDGSFCCGKMDPQLCCASDRRMFLPNNATIIENSTFSSPTPSSTSVVATSRPSEPLKKQAKIGIGVGVSVFVIAIAAALVLMVQAISRRKEQRDVVGSTYSAPTGVNPAEIKGTEIYEKDGDERYEVEQCTLKPKELRGDPRSAVELPEEIGFCREDGNIPK
jgi:hypothetical protein